MDNSSMNFQKGDQLMSNFSSEPSMFWFLSDYGVLESLILRQAFKADPTCIPGVSTDFGDDMDRVIELCRRRRVDLRDRAILAGQLAGKMCGSSGTCRDVFLQTRQQFRDDCWDFMMEHCQKELPGVYFRTLIPTINAIMKILDDPRRIETDKQDIEKT